MYGRNTKPRRAVAVPAALLAGVLSAGAAPAGGTAERPDVPELTWTSCHLVYQCAKVNVPLDYDDPDGKTIELALIRKPASDPQRRIGSLFINPGGPGVSIATPGTFLPISMGLGPQVRSRFDLIGIDPRGTGASTPLSCPRTPDIKPVPEPELYPTDGQYDGYFAYNEYVRKTCEATGGEILDHMSSADTARDLDLIRQAVGDEQLSFYGASYGAVVGQVYAALFPGRVRALAVDGVFDPEKWTTGEQPPFARVQTGKTVNDSVLALLERCDRANILQCPLSGNARQRFQRVVASLDERPLPLPFELPLPIGKHEIDDKIFVWMTQTAFAAERQMGLPLETSRLWLGIVRLIDTVRFGPAPPDPETGQAITARLRTLLGTLNRAGATSPEARNAGARNADAPVHDAADPYAVWCADAEAPAGRQAWIDAGDAADTAGLGFGPYQTWTSSVCANWPGSSADAYRGSFDVTTATPPLMMTLTHDTATSAANAHAAADHYPGARVAEIRSWGHTTLGKSNGCLKPVVDAYLIEQRLPDDDVVCEPDHGLFGLAP